MIIHTSRDQDTGGRDTWTAPYVAETLAANDAESRVYALRAVAALTALSAERPDDISDPRTILVDLKHAADSMRAIASVVITAYELDESDRDEAVGELGALETATAHLHALSDNL